MPRSVLLPPKARNAASRLVRKEPAPVMELNWAPYGSPHTVLGPGFGPKSEEIVPPTEPAAPPPPSAEGWFPSPAQQPYPRPACKIQRVLYATYIQDIYTERERQTTEESV